MTKACSQCKWCWNLCSNWSYCVKTHTNFTHFEELFWEIECGYFSQITWPRPINQSWREFYPIQRRAVDVRRIMAVKPKAIIKKIRRLCHE